MNRAALKMVEVILDFTLRVAFLVTDYVLISLDQIDQMIALFDTLCPHALLDDGTLYFADVCAGPGGFTEYVMWRGYSLSEHVKPDNMR